VVVGADRLLEPDDAELVEPTGDAHGLLDVVAAVGVDVHLDVCPHRLPGQGDAVEVATFDSRTPAQRDRFAATRSRLIDRLTSEGAADLVPFVDTNLFGMSVDPRLSAADQRDLTTLIDLGQPMAVFLAPPPSDDDPNAA